MTLTEAVSSVVALTAGRYTMDDGKKPMKKAAATATTALAGMTLGVLGQSRGPQVMGTTDTVTVLPPVSQGPPPALAGPPPMSAQTLPPVPTSGTLLPYTPAVMPDPVQAVPSATAPLSVVPVEFSPTPPGVVSPSAVGKPPLLGVDASPTPLGMIPTGRASQGLLSRPTSPPPVVAIPGSNSVEKAVADAVAKLGTDPGIPAYYEMAVKEVDGVSVTMTWTANTFVNRIYFDIRTATSFGDSVMRERFKVSANFARGKDGTFYGIITDVDVEQGGPEFGSGTSITKALTGALFKFTQKEVDGKLATRDVVILSATAEKGDLYGIAEVLAGKYTGSPGKPAGPPKPVPGRHVPGKATKE